MDVINGAGEAALRKEQDVLDEHNDEISSLAARLQEFIVICSTIADPDIRKVPSRRLARLDKSLSSISNRIKSITGDSSDTCLIHQYEEQVSDLKKELVSVRDSLLLLDLDDSDELNVPVAKLEKLIFDCSLSLKKLLKNRATDTSVSDSKGVKLPKLDMPTFNSDILNCRSF